ncbi:ATP-binding cassette domain-containing protein [Phytohabitans houttuyneae]|jgi:oleandomycin transport system ATP-binding protein|uniref:Daunorubicin resistance protein DrrA family ABC transporter ATP-binding protein n=1 Tax=Phytohabitans houttuyneae TaxID=1076126 RepID=A0A6V8K1H4_9ACTN|nr:ATP-binding cassette domain-containing protein [Phytohabitans houttuyneae]GFJ76138.1 daunorubicin resistance protein DrrA family ABC transporter ATP-binding protein [Phytohabitans houttuyneae]
MEYAVETTGLVKRFGAVTALDGVDLAVPAGTVLGVLGPNGAGKTTAVRILATLLRPDAGSARVGGFDVRREAHRVRELIGLTGQYASVDNDLSARHNLVMLGRILGLSRPEARRRADELLTDFGLADAGGRTVRGFSGGMRRRLDLAASLVGRPRVLFLDEPTSGLDPARRGQLWSRVRDLAAEGTTVLLTTQYLEEADQLADTVAVFDRGTVVARGTPDALKRRSGRQTLDLRLADAARLPDAMSIVESMAGGRPVPDAARGTLSVPLADAAMMPAIVWRVDEAGIEIAELALRLPSLDDVFLALTGHATRAPASASHVPERNAA